MNELPHVGSYILWTFTTPAGTGAVPW
jgi:hypothetical protein